MKLIVFILLVFFYSCSSNTHLEQEYEKKYHYYASMLDYYSYRSQQSNIAKDFLMGENYNDTAMIYLDSMTIISNEIDSLLLIGDYKK